MAGARFGAASCAKCVGRALRGEGVRTRTGNGGGAIFPSLRPKLPQLPRVTVGELRSRQHDEEIMNWLRCSTVRSSAPAHHLAFLVACSLSGLTMLGCQNA